MKLKVLMVLASILMVELSAIAQVTDQELKKYTITMDSIETLKNQLTVTMNNLSKGNSKISPTRFNSLMPIITNDAKLVEAKATPEEISYVKKAVGIRDESTKKFQHDYLSLIDDYIGTAVFNKVRNALKSDTILKRKYDSLMVKPVRP